VLDKAISSVEQMVVQDWITLVPPEGTPVVTETLMPNSYSVTLINNMHCSLVKSTFQKCTPAYQIA